MIQTAVRGTLAGIGATVPMTAVIGWGCAMGFLYTPPPAAVTENVAEHAAGKHPDSDSPQFQAVWMTAHLAYGAACGALFALARPLLPRSEIVAGLLFGGTVWSVSYLGLLPALGVFPSANDDAPRRQQVMIAAHTVFGVSCAGLEHSLRNDVT